MEHIKLCLCYDDYSGYCFIVNGSYFVPDKQRGKYFKTQAEFDVVKDALKKRVKAALEKNDLDSIKTLADRLRQKMRKDEFPIEYDDIEVSYAYGSRSWEDGSYAHEGTDNISYTYVTTSADVCEDVISEHWDEFLPDLNYNDPDFEDKLWQYMYDNLDELSEKYSREIDDYYADRAAEEAQEEYEYDPYDD